MVNNVRVVQFQVRAYTAGDKFSETAWSQPISTDPDNTAILVGITVPIILLVLILLAFVLLRKLNCAPCNKSSTHHSGRDHPADLVRKFGHLHTVPYMGQIDAEMSHWES